MCRVAYIRRQRPGAPILGFERARAEQRTEEEEREERRRVKERARTRVGEGEEEKEATRRWREYARGIPAEYRGTTLSSLPPCRYLSSSSIPSSLFLSLDYTHTHSELFPTPLSFIPSLVAVYATPSLSYPPTDDYLSLSRPRARQCRLTTSRSHPLPFLLSFSGRAASERARCPRSTTCCDVRCALRAPGESGVEIFSVVCSDALSQCVPYDRSLKVASVNKVQRRETKEETEI